MLFRSGGGPEKTTQQTILDPKLLQMYKGYLTEYQKQVQQQYQPQAELAAQQIQTGFTPQFSATPDAMTRGLAAQAGQQMAQQSTAQRQAIANQFRGQPGAALALQRQADIQSRLQQNPLLFQAFQQQQGRELTQAQQQQAAAEAANRALLGREQAVTGLAQTGLGAQQNLLSTLLSLGQGLGQQVQTGEMKGRSGGLFGK